MRRGDLVVLNREAVRTMSFKREVRLGPGRVCLMAGQALPGKVTILGVFEDKNGRPILSYRSVPADAVCPLPEPLGSLLHRDMVEYVR